MTHSLPAALSAPAFATHNEPLANECLSFLKNLYDTRHQVSSRRFGPLESLPVSGLDEDQLWQVLVTANEPTLTWAKATLVPVREEAERETPEADAESSSGTSEVASDDSAGDSGSNLEDGDAENGLGSDLEGASAEAEFEGDVSEPDNNGEKLGKPSGDRFFSFEDMEKFVEAQEDEDYMDMDLTGNDDRADDDDGFGDEDDLSDDEDGAEAKYGDFFDPPSAMEAQKSARDVLFDDDEGASESGEEDDSGEEDKGSGADDLAAHSKFASQQERVKCRIAELEAKNLEKKSWQMQGEVSSKQRPQNSLLEVPLDFDFAAKLPPVVTQVHTLSLEDLIKKRIKDQHFDDPAPRIQDAPDGRVKPRKADLSDEKSKVGLGDIYAEEFVRAQSGDGEEVNKEVLALRREALGVFRSLSNSLHALSNFHFTPKVSTEEPVVSLQAPAVSMEEATPVAVSDANVLAPQEVFSRSKEAVKGEAEITREERRRVRAGKKVRKAKQQREKEIRQKAVLQRNPALGDKIVRKRALDELEAAAKKNIKSKTGKPLSGGSKGAGALAAGIVTTEATTKLLQKRKRRKTQKGDS
eukprot:Rmarinus@m.23957